MPSKGFIQSRAIPLLAALFGIYFTYVLFHVYSSNAESIHQYFNKPNDVPNESIPQTLDQPVAETVVEVQPEELSTSVEVQATYNDQSENHEYSTCVDTDKYNELFSITRPDRKFYPIIMGRNSYNPNVINHPTNADSYIVVAQYEHYNQTDIEPIEELLCVAKFRDGELHCTSATIAIPAEKSIIGKCEDGLGYMNFRFGPRDARVFYGPENPYIIYGSQGRLACLSMWSQDFRMLTADLNIHWPETEGWYENATELHRPPPYGGFEKNFFFFYDWDNRTYVHNDLYPSRVFAEIDATGTVGEDLAPKSTMDGQCLDKYLPKVDKTYDVEGIHQATNSLSVTLCKRADPDCIPNDKNTYIMHIFQHKAFYDAHAIYEPYVILFRRSFPFAFYGIGQKPLWITGRDRFTSKTHSVEWEVKGWDYPTDATELFYVTSMSWKEHGMRYHGYMDDVMLLNFGIEDSSSGTIDFRAEDLLQDLEICDT